MKSWPTVYLPPAPTFIIHPRLKLSDSYTSKRESIEGTSVTSYVCGITPYDATHLGHAATYLTFDLIHRYLIASGAKLSFTQNITDIDDPLLARASRDNQDWRELARSQIDLFCDDMAALRVIPPSNYRGVVESMSTIIQYIERLMSKGNCYELDGDIYLDLSQIPGALANLPIPEAEAIEIFKARGGDPEREGKRHPLDTLIWMRKRPGEPAWESSMGEGRPGWHIECVAIALNTLSPENETTNSKRTSISLQGGGSDLRFPHHYMTAVQAKALTGEAFASIYCHAGMVAWQGEKMSKSLGNLVFVSKLIEEGWRPEEIRLALIDRQYADDFEWNPEALDDAKALLGRLISCLSREEVAPSREIVQGIVSALADDLNVPKAIELLVAWCEATETGQIGGNAGEIARAIDLYLGIAI